jgi:hypothetical protein
MTHESAADRSMRSTCVRAAIPSFSAHEATGRILIAAGRGGDVYTPAIEIWAALDGLALTGGEAVAQPIGLVEYAELLCQYAAGQGIRPAAPAAAESDPHYINWSRPIL